MFIEYNPNPVGRYDTGDCAIRAIAKALGESWENAYLRLCVAGFMMGDLPNGDSVFGAVLRQNGFKKKTIADTCPDCYTVEDFTRDNPVGTFVLGLGGHVVTVVDGDIYDSTNSSRGIPIYFWYKDDGRETHNGEPISTNANNGVPANAANDADAAASNRKPASAK